MKNRIFKEMMIVFVIFMYIAVSDCELNYVIGDVLDAFCIEDGPGVITTLLLASFMIACTIEISRTYISDIEKVIVSKYNYYKTQIVKMTKKVVVK